MREILQLAKTDPPVARRGVEDIVAAGRRRRRRALGQRLGGASVLAAGMLTLSVLAAINLVLGPSGGPAASPPAALPPAVPAAPAPAPPFTFTFAGYQVGAYRVLPPDEVSLVDQSAGVVREDAGGTTYAGTLTIYQPKAFDPRQLETVAALEVEGRDAYQVSLAAPVSGWDVGGVVRTDAGHGTVAADTGISGLAWQYAPDAWAVLTNDAFAQPMALADQLAIAEGLGEAGTLGTVATVPFQTGYLPAGFTLLSVSGQSLMAEHRGMVSFVYGPQPPAVAPSAEPAPDAATVPSVEISILWVDSPPPDAVERTSRCNSGQAWCATTLPGGEFYVAVADPSKTLSDAELLQISDGLRFADLKDATTWYPVA